MFYYVVLLCSLACTLIADSKPLTRGSQQMAFDLMRTLGNKEYNLCFSPYSLSSALSMTYAGARGSTKAEMQYVLGFNSDPEVVSASFSELAQSLAAPNLSTANALWIQKDMQILPAFSLLMKTYYHAELNRVDFQSQPEVARVNINNWASQATNGKIRDLIAPSALSQATRMVLTSAIYFKARWSQPFMEKQTSKQPFYGLDEGAMTVPMMTNTEEYPYFEDKTVRVIQLPYKDSQLAMLCVLPFVELDQFEEQLLPSSFNQWLGGLSPERIQLFFPKFKINSSLSLEDPLNQMGMASAFSEQADFSGINGARNLQISSVVQKAFIAADEAGTEAAAATAVIMNLKMSLNEKEPKTLRIDRPFLYFIYDKESHAILFMGRVVNPLE